MASERERIMKECFENIGEEELDGMIPVCLTGKTRDEIELAVLEELANMDIPLIQDVLRGENTRVEDGGSPPEVETPSSKNPPLEDGRSPPEVETPSSKNPPLEDGRSPPEVETPSSKEPSPSSPQSSIDFSFTP